jgi:nucleotide-binding universal stress UspA family protein
MTEVKKFSKILVATDGSEPSINVADYAISVAKNYCTQLMILNVIPSDMSLFGPEVPPHLNELKEEAQMYLDKLVQKAKTGYDGIQVESKIIASPSVVGGIVNFAENEGVDLIVVGTRGRSSLKKLLLGSVASGIVSYAHCPVMIVK